jgi:hypothetical protein
MMDEQVNGRKIMSIQDQIEELRIRERDLELEMDEVREAIRPLEKEFINLLEESEKTHAKRAELMLSTFTDDNIDWKLILCDNAQCVRSYAKKYLWEHFHFTDSLGLATIIIDRGNVEHKEKTLLGIRTLLPYKPASINPDYKDFVEFSIFEHDLCETRCPILFVKRDLSKIVIEDGTWDKHGDAWEFDSLEDAIEEISNKYWHHDETLSETTVNKRRYNRKD